MSEVEKFFVEEIPERFREAVARLEKRVEEAEASGDERAASLRARLDGIREIQATLRFEISGEKGRDYFFNQQGGDLTVSDAPATEPLIWVTQTVEDFETLRDLIMAQRGTGEGGGGSGSLRLGGPLRADVVAQVGAMDSVLKLVLTDLPETGEATTLVRLGTGARRDDPDMTLSLTHDTYLQLAAGQLTPPQAFMTGLLRIEGDMSIAMRLAALGM